VTVIANTDSDRGPRAAVHGARAGLAVLVLAGLLLVSACGFGAQTLRPYTPSEGVNFDVGDPSDPTKVVHVRNLLVIVRTPGSGIISGSMVTAGNDSLTAVSGAPYKVDGSKGAPFTATLPSPIRLTSNALVVLTDQSPLLSVKSPDLVAGLDTEITVQFAQAGSHTARTTVVDGNVAPYNTISPSPRASASPSA